MFGRPAWMSPAYSPITFSLWGSYPTSGTQLIDEQWDVLWHSCFHLDWARQRKVIASKISIIVTWNMALATWFIWIFNLISKPHFTSPIIISRLPTDSANSKFLNIMVRWLIVSIVGRHLPSTSFHVQKAMQTSLCLMKCKILGNIMTRLEIVMKNYSLYSLLSGINMLR